MSIVDKGQIDFQLIGLVSKNHNCPLAPPPAPHCTGKESFKNSTCLVVVTFQVFLQSSVHLHRFPLTAIQVLCSYRNSDTECVTKSIKKRFHRFQPDLTERSEK